MEAEAPAVQTLRDWPGDSTASCGHGGATRWGQETGLYRGLRAEDSESETGQMAEVRVQRGQQAGAAGVPGQSRAQDPGGVCDRGRTAAARRRLHSRRQAQGGVLREADGGSAQSAVHEGGPGVRGPVLRSAGAVFRSGWGGEQCVNDCVVFPPTVCSQEMNDSHSVSSTCWTNSCSQPGRAPEGSCTVFALHYVS